MREHPILFSGPMVLAILEGRKTQTRRAVKPQPPSPEAAKKLAGDTYHWMAPTPRIDHWRVAGPVWAVRDLMGQEPHLRCPYGKPGGHLWVRETWGPAFDHPSTQILYGADGGGVRPWDGRWRPSIHMPRWASRLTLEVTEVRVQRLQEISEKDAQAEGVLAAPFCKTGRANGLEHVEAFEDLWQSINGARPGCSWEANPWVWAISFGRLEG